jgi:hypothetical protein
MACGHCSGIDMCLPNKKSNPELTKVRAEQMDKCVEHLSKGPHREYCCCSNQFVSIERTVEKKK